MNQVFAAVKALIVDQDKILALNTNVNDQILWDLPGGKVDYGEDAYQALHREVQEEVALKIDIVKPIGMWWFFRDDGNQVVCNTFLCTIVSGKVDLSQNPADENITSAEWLTKNQLLEKLKNEQDDRNRDNSLFQLINRLELS